MVCSAAQAIPIDFKCNAANGLKHGVFNGAVSSAASHTSLAAQYDFQLSKHLTYSKNKQHHLSNNINITQKRIPVKPVSDTACCWAFRLPPVIISIVDEYLLDDRWAQRSFEICKESNSPKGLFAFLYFQQLIHLILDKLFILGV